MERALFKFCPGILTVETTAQGVLLQVAGLGGLLPAAQLVVT